MQRIESDPLREKYGARIIEMLVFLNFVVFGSPVTNLSVSRTLCP